MLNTYSDIPLNDIRSKYCVYDSGIYLFILWDHTTRLYYIICSLATVCMYVNIFKNLFF